MTEELTRQLSHLVLSRVSTIESDTAHEYLLKECRHTLPFLPSLLMATKGFVFGSFALKAFFPDETWVPSDINIMVPLRSSQVLLDKLVTEGYTESPTLVSRHLAPRFAWKETTYTKSFEHPERDQRPWRIVLTMYDGGYNSIELSKQLMQVVDIDVTALQWMAFDNRFPAPCTLEQLLAGDWHLTAKVRELQLFPPLSIKSLQYQASLARRDSMRLHVIQHLHLYEQRGHQLPETSNLLFSILLEHKTARQITYQSAEVDEKDGE